MAMIERREGLARSPRSSGWGSTSLLRQAASDEIKGRVLVPRGGRRAVVWDQRVGKKVREGGNGLAWTWTWMEEQIEEGFGRERRGAKKRLLVCVRLSVLASFLFYRAPCTGHT